MQLFWNFGQDTNSGLHSEPLPRRVSLNFSQQNIRLTAIDPEFPAAKASPFFPTTSKWLNRLKREVASLCGKTTPFVNVTKCYKRLDTKKCWRDNQRFNLIFVTFLYNNTLVINALVPLPKSTGLGINLNAAVTACGKPGYLCGKTCTTCGKDGEFMGKIWGKNKNCKEFRSEERDRRRHFQCQNAKMLD